MLNHIPISEQLPLIHDIHADDQLLLNCPDADWYSKLKFFPWEDYREIGAQYYDALHHFNQPSDPEPVIDDTDETKKQAAQRHLSDRPTINKTQPVLYQPEFKSVPVPTVSPFKIAPGILPHRDAGKKPKCFFAMFKCFIGATLMGLPPEPEKVHFLLTSNLSFARVCGFIPKGAEQESLSKYVPSLRKLEQFDQIMTDYGLWNRCKQQEIHTNIENGVIKEENIVVGDTTHYYAYSGFETVTYTDENGKEKKKSQSKVTKNCRCEDQENCPHPWDLADEGAGTIVKGKGSKKIIWGHKASIVGLPLQGIPLDARCVADAATHDSQTFYPHVVSLFEDHPEIQPWFDIALYDSACDIDKLKEQFRMDLGIQLKTSLNPRRRYTITANLPKGMDRLTPYANLVCRGGQIMDYQGVRYDMEKFIYRSPLDENNEPVCNTCPNKLECCPFSEKGRVATIDFDLLPHIDPNDPPMAKRFKAIMTRRPSVERMIKRLKCDLSDDRLSKRGNASFQAYLDKTMIAFHILLR